MKTFKQFISEVKDYYDPDIAGRSSIKRVDPEGRIQPNRKKNPEDIKSRKAIGGKKTVPTKSPKINSTAGKPKSEKAPDKESAQKSYTAHLLAKEKETRGRRRKGLAAKPDSAYVKQHKKPEKKVDPNYKPQKMSGWTAPERKKLQQQGDKLIRDIKKGKERGASSYKPFK